MIGIVGTVLVSRYYFQRSTKKEISSFSLLASQVFAGIEPQVRRRLRFTFHDEEVRELSQLGFLIANTGERAISGFIEPPTIELPKDAKVLDASIEHRSPKDLRASLRVSGEPVIGQSIVCEIPLLNRGEYFVVRLLISGGVTFRELEVRLLADDLPRVIKFQALPYEATRERKSGVEWGAFAAGAIICGVAFCIGYSLWLLHLRQADLFALPWSTFKPSLEAFAVNVSVILLLLLAVLGLGIGIGAGLGEAFSRAPRFPLPSHIGRGQILMGAPFSMEAPKGDVASQGGEAARQ
jgi:hypothetical protein